MDNYTQNFKPVHINELVANAGRFIYVNRQSDKGNAHGHARHEPALAGAHARLSPNASFRPYYFTGSGCVRTLNDAFDSGYVEGTLTGTRG
jgi:hypothetical protein